MCYNIDMFCLKMFVFIAFRWCRQPGFLSANIYLLGNAESRNADPDPQPTPVLSDYHLLDNDRHASGLGCYSKDHLRAPLEKDAEIKPLQRAQDKKDYLTDSESDNEDGYGDFKPTMEKVKKLLVPPPPPKVKCCIIVPPFLKIICL